MNPRGEGGLAELSDRLKKVTIPDDQALCRALVHVESELRLEVLLADGPKRLTEGERRKLLEAIRAGEHVELLFAARTFVQIEGKANRNFVRFRDGALLALARSFKGQPFLRDHGQWAVDDRGGTIVHSELVRDDEQTAAIEMQIRAVKPWAVEGLLDGTIDRFSVGWHTSEPTLCSVHKRARTGPDGCWCYPGKLVDGVAAEVIFQSATGVEVSAVNVPAVPEAKGVEIRAALDAAHGAAGGREEECMDKVRHALGLAAAATEDEIVAALAKLKEEREDLSLRLNASREKVEHLEKRLDAIETEAAAAAKKAESEKIEARLQELRSTGAIPAQAGSGAEKVLRAAAVRGGVDEFELAAADYKPGQFAPVGQPMQLAPGGGKTEGVAITPELAVALRACGLTEEDFRKHGPHARAQGGV